MATEVSDWISLAAMATSFIAYLEAKKDNRTASSLSALQELVDASDKTQCYLQQRADGLYRNRETEWELARLWSRAALSISLIDKELAVRLSAKSEFWRRPETWDTDLRAHRDISLESVQADARRLQAEYA